MKGLFCSKKLRNPKTLSHESRDRIFGWLLTVLGFLGLITDAISFHVINPFYGVILVAGLWLIARSVHLIQESDTTRALKLEAFLDKKKGNHAHKIHQSAFITRAKKPLSKKELILQNQVLAVGVWLLATIILSIAFNFLLIYSPPVFLIVTLGVALGLIGFGYSEKNLLWVFFGAVIAILVQVGVLNLLVQAELTPFLELILTWSSLFLYLIIFFVIAVYRRHFSDIPLKHLLAKITLVLTSLGFLTVYGTVSVNTGASSWPLALLIYTALTLNMGVLAWVREERSSYAKHLLVLAGMAFLVYAFVYLAPVLMALIWFALAVGMLSIGLLMPSYSARVLGLGVLGISVVHYLIKIIPSQDGNVLNPLLQDRTWMGFIIAAFLVIISRWYQDIRSRGVEKLLLPMIRQSLMFFAYIILFALIVSISSGIWQSVLLMVLFADAFIAGRMNRFSLLAWMGSGCFMLNVINFLLRDIKNLSESARLSSFFIAALFFIIIGIYAAWVEHRLSQAPLRHRRH